MAEVSIDKDIAQFDISTEDTVLYLCLIDSSAINGNKKESVIFYSFGGSVSREVIYKSYADSVPFFEKKMKSLEEKKNQQYYIDAIKDLVEELNRHD